LWLIFKNTNSREGIEDKMGIPESSLDESLQSLTKFGLIEMQQQNFFLTPTGYVIAVETPEEIRKLGQ
jgi:predicted transcriptional regulator